MRLAFVGTVLVLAFAASTAAASRIGPGALPPQCNAAFQFPGPGLYPTGGCLVQGAGGLTIEPKVVRVGESLTATISEPPAAAHATWDWGNFAATAGFGSKHLHGCMPQDTSCTVQASARAVSDVWETYMHGVNTNVIPCCGGLSVSSDYFIVNDSLFRVSGTVTDTDGTPAPGVRVTIAGNGERVRRHGCVRELHACGQARKLHGRSPRGTVQTG